MKKNLLLLCVMSLCVSLVGCGEKDTLNRPSNAALSETTTETTETTAESTVPSETTTTKEQTTATSAASDTSTTTSVAATSVSIVTQIVQQVQQEPAQPAEQPAPVETPPPPQEQPAAVQSFDFNVSEISRKENYKSTDDEYFEGYFQIDKVAPQINYTATGMESQQQAINQCLAETLNTEIAFSGDYIAVDSIDNSVDDWDLMYDNQTYTQQRINNCWCVCIAYDGYYGGAHGSWGEYNYCFDIRNGARVSLQSILSSNGVITLTYYLLDHYSQEYSELMHWGYEGISSALSDGFLWRIDGQQLILMFNHYVLGSYADGPQWISIPLSDVPLNDYGKALLGV